YRAPSGAADCATARAGLTPIAAPTAAAPAPAFAKNDRLAMRARLSLMMSSLVGTELRSPLHYRQQGSLVHEIFPPVLGPRCAGRRDGSLLETPRNHAGGALVPA